MRRGSPPGPQSTSPPAAAVATLCGCALLLPVAVVSGGVESAALPFVAASAVLHVAYLALLARAYRGGQVSVVYPVSRGTAPVLVLVVGVVALGHGVAALAAVGVCLVGAGVLLVGAPSAARAARAASERAVRGPGRERVQIGPKVAQDPLRAGHRDLLFGLAIAVTIAAYTLVDADGVDHAQAPAYLALMLTPAAAVYAAALAAGGRGAALRAELRLRALVTGAFVVGAYGCVLAALRLADAAPVAAVRESSVVIAAILAAAFLHEPVDARRFAGAALVVAGVAAIAYS